MAWLLERLYNECAPIYDTVAMRISHGHWFVWGQSVIPYVQVPVLELGCGSGHLQATFAFQGIPAYGLDRSARMLRSARRRSDRLLQATSQAIPCQNAAFRSVVAVFPTPYISDPTTLNEISRVLRDDGTLIIVLSAGNHDVRSHPLWQSLTGAGWELNTPDCIVGNTRLHLLIGTRHATVV